MLKPSVDEFIERSDWVDALGALRAIITSCDLNETVKWGMPTYTVAGKNIAGMGSFKGYCGIWFFQGALLSDTAGKLMNAQEGKTKAMRQWRFKSLAEIETNRQLIIEYLQEAIDNQKAGKEIKLERKPLVIPELLKEQFGRDKQLAEYFERMSLTNRRDFAEHIAGAKRAETQQKRLEKIIPMIQKGIGLNDKYK